MFLGFGPILLGLFVHPFRILLTGNSRAARRQRHRRAV